MPSKDIHKDIEQMTSRIVAGESTTVVQYINLYCTGVSAKLREAEYAFIRLNELGQTSGTTTSTGPIPIGNDDRIHFYVDAFFAFLYSAFDVFAHVVNQKFALGLDEKKVSIKSVERKLTTSQPDHSMQLEISKFLSSSKFSEFENYRNCSTYRRQIYIQTVIRSGTPGYWSTGSIRSIQWLICDNPLALDPTVKKEKDLHETCKKMLDWAKLEIRKLSKLF